MLIWSRWGFLLVPIAILGAMTASLIGAGIRAVAPTLAGPANIAAITLSFVIGGALAGWLAWLLHRWQDAKPSRTLVDPKTGQHFEIKQTAGSLFFIPVRYWAFILPVLLGLMGLSVATVPPTA